MKAQTEIVAIIRDHVIYLGRKGSNPLTFGLKFLFLNSSRYWYLENMHFRIRPLRSIGVDTAGP